VPAVAEWPGSCRHRPLPALISCPPGPASHSWSAVPSQLAVCPLSRHRHAAALARVPVRVAAGYDDPFYPGVQALARALPAAAVVDCAKGCHDGDFFSSQQPPSLAFLAASLTS
jgi:hypothetical protein